MGSSTGEKSSCQGADLVAPVHDHAMLVLLTTWYSWGRLRSVLTDALLRLFATHYRKLSSIVTVTQSRLLLPGFLSSVFSVAHCLAPAHQVTTLWRYTNMFIIIVINFLPQGV